MVYRQSKKNNGFISLRLDQDMKAPKVTVLMPVFNGEKYLKQSIESILNQRFRDFEFLIINDGSSDGSLEIISSYTDSRIRLVSNETNKGLVYALNRGLELASGEYIARMDCDDISKKSRLSVQVSFMDHNTSIGACGSYYSVMRGNKRATADFPMHAEEIKCFLLFNSPIAHPTAMIRTILIRQHQLCYSSEFVHAEDYDFWSRLSGLSELSNIPKVLVDYRLHAEQVSTVTKNAAAKLSSISRLRLRHLAILGIEPSEEELHIHNVLSDGIAPVSLSEVKMTEQWLKKLVRVNDDKNAVDRFYLQKIVLERWLRLCFNFHKGKPAFRFFFESELYSIIQIPVGRKFELLRNFYYSWKRRRIQA
jgi:glycosyltransferase involved in cell wall biosynthesis